MKNAISLQGRLGRDPELTEKQGQNGPFKSTSFSLAVDRDFGDETDWFNCELIGKQAEVFEKFIHKGDMVLIDGQMLSYKPKRNPEQKSWFVKVNKFWFVDKRSDTFRQVDNWSKGEHETSTKEPAPDGFENIDEDVPF